MARLGSSALRQALDAILELDRVLRLAINGIGKTAVSVPLVEAIEDYEREHGTEKDLDASKARVASARADAAFAQTEVDRGFPILHAHAVVALWGILEAVVEDLVLEILDADASCFAHPTLASVKIPLGEYELLDRGERHRFLLGECARNSKADLKLGVTRFEVLLEIVRLSGPINEALKRDIFEHQQVRNVIVHRAGRADRRIVGSCPWLGLKIGAAIMVSREQWRRYLDAVTAYMVELITRLFVRDGMTREQAEAHMHRQGPREPQTTHGEMGIAVTSDEGGDKDLASGVTE